MQILKSISNRSKYLGTSYIIMYFYVIRSNVSSVVLNFDRERERQQIRGAEAASVDRVDGRGGTDGERPVPQSIV